MIVRFGRLTFAVDRRQVLDATGVALHLTPKAFDLLALLIANAPRVVPKAELHDRLWPGIFVSDAALSSLIKELRRTLQDQDPAEPIIRTSHGVGYAFAAALEEAGPGHAKAGASTGTRHWIVTVDHRISLGEGAHLVGRDPEAVIFLDVAGVSRRHARIVVRGRQAEIEDLASKNGTMLNDVRLTARTDLHDGDQIRIGPVSVAYAFAERGQSTDTMLVR